MSLLNDAQKRLALIITGQVQGVGFRPFVWRYATQADLAGFVRNTSLGVRIEIQGSPEKVDRFLSGFEAELPPLARIASMNVENMPPVPGESSFRIEKSQDGGSSAILVSPDIGICQECLADIRDPANRRHGYAFTNCTNCGPRYSITRDLPYDRPMTCMACFELCGACAAEYANPADRRFHAQPVACASCGPRLWYVDKKSLLAKKNLPDSDNMTAALARAGRLLLTGGILALKGLGGYQLACDARNLNAVARLRERKKRPHKALAVMTRGIEATASFCHLDREHEDLLSSIARPVVLCPADHDASRPLVPLIAPDTDHIGVMLPNTPLHALLLDWLAEATGAEPALVMTSANRAGEPICLGNREALASLAHLADGWLLHDRDILVRVDDSVVATGSRAFPGNTFFIRRARGYVPEPVRLPVADNTKPVLGAGAELKATFCLTRGSMAFLGQHIGDLKNPRTLEFYQDALAHLQNLLGVSPAAIVHDLHPDFISTRFAMDLAERLAVPVMGLQHHVAHAAGCLAENGIAGEALAICLDGAGLGADGTIWGGELIYVNLAEAQWRRVGSLSPFALPGGDAAAREPWRICRSLLFGIGESAFACWPEAAAQAVDEMLARNVNCAVTSSCGRLFDGIAALAGLCQVSEYEGQAPMRLEKAARGWLAGHSPKDLPLMQEPAPIIMRDSLTMLHSHALFARMLAIKKTGASSGLLAAAFHFELARGIADLASLKAGELRIRQVALTGGVMHNLLLASLLADFLRAKGLDVIGHKKLPPGDGGLSLGQAMWGSRLLELGRL